MMGTLHGDQYIFLIISHLFLLKMKNISDKIVEKIKTRILCPVTFFFQKSCFFLDNVEKFGRARQATDDSIIWHMRFACWILKGTNTCLDYVILIALSLQQ